MSSKVDVSICIVNWNAKEYLDRCLRSIQETVPPIRFETIVVDNASGDGSQESVKKNHPDVILIENTENLGFAAANNQALEKAKGETVFLLNPDSELLPGCLEKLRKALKKYPAAAVVAPKLLNTDKSLQRSVRRFPTYKTVLYRYTFLKKLGIFAKDEARNKMDDFEFDRELPVEQPAGAALLIRKEVLDKVGWMDPAFFLFYEEVDLCRRIKQRGHEILFIPGARMIHHQGKSRQKNRRQIFLPTVKSMFYYFNKNHGERTTRLFKWVFKPLFVFSTFWDVLEEGLSYWIYRIKKDDYRAKRKKERCHLKALFLKNDLFEFIFRT